MVSKASASGYTEGVVESLVINVERSVSDSSPANQKTVQHEERVLEGARFDVHQLTLRGSDGKDYVREVVRHPGAVVLLPILDDDKVVLIKNTRPQVNETLIELPAGTREPDEEAESTAFRELIEETGYRASELRLLHTFFSAPGICDELMYLFVATGLSEGQHRREATEQIENVTATRDQVGQWMAEGKIRDAKSLIGLYAFLYSPELNSNLAR